MVGFVFIGSMVARDGYLCIDVVWSRGQPSRA